MFHGWIIRQMYFMKSLVVTKLWRFNRDTKKHHKVPEEIYMMTETSLDDVHTLSHEKLWSHYSLAS